MKRWWIPRSAKRGARTSGGGARLLLAAVALGGLAFSGPLEAGPNFRRGDSNGDGHLDLSDPINTLFFLFTGGVSLSCLEASDADDSGSLDLSDAIYSLNYLFTGGPAPPAPGPADCGADPTNDGLGCVSYPGCPTPSTDLEAIGHLLNRAAYGPTFDEVDRISTMGIQAWIDEQLNPTSINDSALAPRIAPLMETVVRSEDLPIVSAGDLWHYWKGSTAPPANWRTTAGDDSAWPVGPSGFGYGDNDDATVISDMQNNYLAVFIRRQFTVADPTVIRSLILSVNYDDGFVAYLNGTEVARKNMAGNVGTLPAYNAAATVSHEAGSFEDFDITTKKGLLVAGSNLLAIEVHNQIISSPDLSMIPELLDRKVLPGGTTTEIKGIGELKALAHIYSIYSDRQLQAVLGDFWENHFTTDYDKVFDYLDNLKNSDASKALTTAQAQKEAARLSHHEYEFFRQNALGSFGDLLNYSARSPTMLIYLDNVLNVKGSANENYAREIQELHTMGADNGYVQTDIEQLAKCFTGWGVCKVVLADAGDPNALCGVQLKDTPILAAGPSAGNWRYMKGTLEPPVDWKNQGFADSGWLAGPAGIGYGDGDDATVLTDMMNNYTTIYARKTFTVADPSTLKNIILSIDVDDGFVAYLNGTEVARYYAPGEMGVPVPFDSLATLGHEAGTPLEFNLNAKRSLFVAGTNTLAVQVLNVAKNSSDLSMIPSIVDREILPGSIENGDPNAVWSFHFFPTLHNSTDSKTLYKGTPYQLLIPAGRVGAAGIQDAQDAINRILSHPSTATFVCCKLIQRFVGDEIDFRNPSTGPYSALLAKCIGAWNTLDGQGKKGNIANVMRVILTQDLDPDPTKRVTGFWSETARRSKVKSGFEYIASTARVLDATTNGVAVVDDLSAMGMDLFTRDEPDGWPEVGSKLVDTASILARMKFAQALTEGTLANSPDLYWSGQAYLTAHGINTADKAVDFFDQLLFQSTLSDEDRAMVKEFLTTNDTYQGPVAFSATQVEQALGLMLSLPQWQFQ